MKKSIVYFPVLFLFALLSHNLTAQVELEVKGSITHVFKDKAVVNGYVPRNSECYDIGHTKIEEINGRKARTGVRDREYEGLWLGVTVVIRHSSSDEEEIDFRPRLVKGSFKESYEVDNSKVMGASSVKWTAALWEGRVDKQACREWNDGRECNYCRRNGHHMYTLVEKSSW